MDFPFNSEADIFESILATDEKDIEKTAQSPEELADILPQTALGYDM